MKIMVTGGAGFIGSHVVDGYIRSGHQVLVIDNLYTGQLANVNPEAKFYEMDVRSPDIDQLMKKERPDLLNHHAAQMSVPVSVEDPLLDADINIKGLLNLLESSVKYGVKKFIFISSGGAIYGPSSEVPITEDYPPKPLSPYAISKLASEYYLSYYGHQYGLDYTILRYANVYGPRQAPHGEAGVVSIFMNNLLEGKRSILNHFPEDSKGMTRDYCFVGDAVRANLRALTGGSRDFFNIGTGQGTKTLELYQLIYDVFREFRPQTDDNLSETVPRKARPGDIPRNCLDIKKARNLLNWTPETDLKNGLRLTLEWRLGGLP